FFFFQAEDGIRDFHVTGVQTCALPISFSVFEMMYAMNASINPKFAHTLSGTIADERRHVGFGENRIGSLVRQYPEKKSEIEQMRSEERRVGKEGRGRGSPEKTQNKTRE